MSADTLTNTFKPATTKWFPFLYLVNPEMCFIIGDVNMHHRELNMYKFGCKTFDVEWFDTSTFITFIQQLYWRRTTFSEFYNLHECQKSCVAIYTNASISDRRSKKKPILTIKMTVIYYMGYLLSVLVADVGQMIKSIIIRTPGFNV